MLPAAAAGLTQSAALDLFPPEASSHRLTKAAQAVRVKHHLSEALLLIMQAAAAAVGHPKTWLVPGVLAAAGLAVMALLTSARITAL